MGPPRLGRISYICRRTQESSRRRRFGPVCCRQRRLLQVRTWLAAMVRPSMTNQGELFRSRGLPHPRHHAPDVARAALCGAASSPTARVFVQTAPGVPVMNRTASGSFVLPTSLTRCFRELPSASGCSRFRGTSASHLPVVRDSRRRCSRSCCALSRNSSTRRCGGVFSRSVGIGASPCDILGEFSPYLFRDPASRELVVIEPEHLAERREPCVAQLVDRADR